MTNDAKSEFSSQVDAVATTFGALKDSVQAATTDPSADTLAAAATAWSAFSTSVNALISDVKKPDLLTNGCRAPRRVTSGRGGQPRDRKPTRAAPATTR